MTPQRLTSTPVPPSGGAFSADASFTNALEVFLGKSKLERRPAVDFRNKTSAGMAGLNNDVRSLVIRYALGNNAAAKNAAVRLADRLGKSMDDRSPFTLLLFCAYKSDKLNRLVIWAFPKDEPLHFSARGDRARIKILKDAFSRS